MVVNREAKIQVVNQKLAALCIAHDLKTAIEVATSVLSLLVDDEIPNSQTVIDAGLISLPNSERQDTWFHQHPWMRGERAAFSILDSSSMPVQAKFYWIRKKTNAIVAGSVHFTKNWEDYDFTRTDSFKIGIDFFLNENADAILIALSNRGKLRVLELSGRLNNTQMDTLVRWSALFGEADRERLHDGLWESFHIQSVNSLFYDGVARSFLVLLEHLTNAGRDEAEAKLFSSRLLGRLIFSWFLRKMRMINEECDYFGEDKVNSQTYYRDVLENLFFGVLNTPVDLRLNGPSVFLDSKTPYLNGGLFAPRKEDWFDDQNLTFPENFFIELFDHFEKFNFTTDESTPDYEQVAIDPEMLGRVFESLLASQVESTGAQARKAKGTFYTPREIVAYMCREAIREHLLLIAPGDSRHERAIEKLLDTSDHEWAIAGSNSVRDIPKETRASILTSLFAMRSLDPACGSGAFPLGLLQTLTKTILRLDPKLDVYVLKLSLLQNNIFGVDIEPMAVEISRLRSWLSLVVEEAGREKVQPLPNLEFNFVCADSLVPLEGVDLHTDVGLQQKLDQCRKDYFTATNSQKKIQLQKRYQTLATPALFDTVDRRGKQLKTFDPFNSNHPAQFFDAEYMFGVGEFNVVIGNPPYEVLEGKHWTDFLAQIRKNHYYKYGLGGRLNLYRLFIERAWHLVAKNSVLSFIVPSTLIADKNATGIRKMLREQGQLEYLIEFPENEKIFESVTQATTIFLARKRQSSDPFQLAIGLKSSELPPREFASLTWDAVQKLSGDGLNLPLIKSSFDLDVLTQIRSDTQPLSRLARSYKGDYNLTTFKSHLSSVPTPHLLFRGEHLHSYWADASVSKPDRRWFNSPDPTVVAKAQRIVCQNVANMGLKQRINAALVPVGSIVGDSCNCIEVRSAEVTLFFLLGILNSKLMNWYFKKFSTNNHVNVYELEELPIRIPNESQRRRIDEAAREISARYDELEGNISESALAELQAMKDSIDTMVFDLYGLTEAQIDVIQNTQIA